MNTIKIKQEKLLNYLPGFDGENVLITSVNGVTKVLVEKPAKIISELDIMDFHLNQLPTDQEVVDLYKIRNIKEGYYLTHEVINGKLRIGTLSLGGIQSHGRVNLRRLITFGESFMYSLLKHLKSDEYTKRSNGQKQLEWFYVERYEIDFT